MRYIICLLLLTNTLFAQNFDTVKIRPQRVTDNIYMLTGSGGNIGLLLGSDGVLMIDDQYAPLSQKISDAIKSLAKNNLRFVVNTHVHGDHSGGNENFKKQGATLVAHEQVRVRMMTEQFNKRFNRTTPPRDKDAWPQITFNTNMNFHVNGEDVDLIHLGKGHTDGDVIVHFKKANVFHAGDAFVRYGYPFIDLSSGGTVNGFIETLDKFLLLLDENSKVIPGHGALATKADVKLLRDQLADIRDQVAAAIKKGTKMEDIAGLGITDKYDEKMGKGFLKGKDFVMMIAESLSAK
ncbi:MAG: MBL fold metallo-hydrolase [Bacteroidota bacterium]|jgi:cyclase|nr:MBL fold metallo-hydrolase [Cytophagales bacterium]MCE2956691.1 MBL fold metallo-hydrolase [Flammeovirgaceae bacterium]MCZ8069333.1 MBL fold metallo-hydrolase [Cytophagales bacterium]